MIGVSFSCRDKGMIWEENQCMILIIDLLSNTQPTYFHLSTSSNPACFFASDEVLGISIDFIESTEYLPFCVYHPYCVHVCYLRITCRISCHLFFTPKEILLAILLCFLCLFEEWQNPDRWRTASALVYRSARNTRWAALKTYGTPPYSPNACVKFAHFLARGPSVGSIKGHRGDFWISTYERRYGGSKPEFKAIFWPPVWANFAALIHGISDSRTKFKNRPDAP